MTEVLFILTIIFVVYVVYAVLGDKPTPGPRFTKPAATPPPATPNTIAPTPPAPSPSIVSVARVEPSPPAAEKPTLPASAVKLLLNPKTGETAPVPNNYRFAKRWIKDALVTEGLLDKVYRNNELDNPANAEKVRGALERLKALPAYQGG